MATATVTMQRDDVTLQTFTFSEDHSDWEKQIDYLATVDFLDSLNIMVTIDAREIGGSVSTMCLYDYVDRLTTELKARGY